MRLIDAERFDVFDTVKPEKYDTESFMAGMEVVLDAIKDAPTIEPKQKKDEIEVENAFVKLIDVFEAIDNNGWAFDEPTWQVEFRSIISKLPRKECIAQSEDERSK